LHLALRITFANQVANFCEHIGADGTRVLRVVGLDHRIGGEFLEPSVGFGGSCLSKDARALRAAAKQVGYDLSLATEILETNESQADRVVEKLAHRLGGLDGTTIALLGLAFKANTDDVRDSPAFRIAARLRARSAVVRGWDPSESARRHAVDERAGDRMTQGEVADEPLEALRGADACVVVTDWRDIKDIDWESAARIMRGRFVLDGRNILEPARIQRTGLVYEGTGRMSRGLLRA
jgi:UDPglucose 6-dehydrogenase